MAKNQKNQGFAAIRDVVSSSRFRESRDYAKALDEVGDFSMLHEQTYAVLDKARRVQLRKEDLEAIGVNDHKVIVTVEDGRIVISAPKV